MAGVPNVFGSATTSIPLSQLDANFNTTATLGNVAIGLGNVTTTVGNLTLTNVNITSGSINAAVVQSGFTANAVIYSNTSGNLTTSANLTFNGTTLTTANDASISGLTVGKGGGSQATNTLLGNGSLTTASAGLRITAVGASVLTASTGNNNTGVGYLASGGNTTGYSNTATGSYALGLNLIGNNNTAVGSVSLYNNTADNNTAVGYESLRSNTTASDNTAVGYQAGYTNVTGTQNTFIGSGAGRTSAVSGEARNVAVGYGAGYGLTTGTYNTFVGPTSGQEVTTGSKNTIIGNYSGNQGGVDIRTSSNNIVLSDGDGNPRGRCDSSANWSFLNNVTVDTYFGVAVAASSVAVIGLSAALNQRDGIRVNTSQSPASGSFISFTNLSGNVAGSITHTGTTTVAYNTSSDYRLKENIAPMTGALAKVQALKPCTYTWKEDGTDGQGFIAHELAEVCPQAVTFGKDAVDDEGNPKYQGVDTSFLVATLAAAIQELNAKVEAQALEIAQLKGN